MTESNGTIQKLRELAQNLWWSWQPEIRAIFREIAPEVWSVVHHNPVALLQRVSEEEITRRVQDLEMQARINQAHRQLQQYLLGADHWGTTHAGPLLAFPVAYFSAEFGLHQSLPIYSGGLGVLAGDHLKSMSDLGVPVVGGGAPLQRGLCPPAHRRKRLAAGHLRADLRGGAAGRSRAWRGRAAGALRGRAAGPQRLGPPLGRGGRPQPAPAARRA